ncbi:MAG TPA: SufD family Fe-S cluster assembly protein [Acidimicrobiales bacterium]|nr:SufD family Fe-S cluster assembly protein [Acidimicrobiales bacterium]
MPVGPGPAPQEGQTLTSFTTEQAGALGGPEWLRARRAAAAGAFAGATLPSANDEEWRYGRVDELDLTAYVPAGVGPAGAGQVAGDGPAGVALPPDVADLVGRIPDPAAVVVVRNGRVAAVTLDEAMAAKGVRVGAATDDDADVVGSVVGATDEAPDAFVTLNDAFAVEPVVVRVPAGVDVARPIVVVHRTESGDGAPVATFPHLVVAAGDDSHLNVVEVQSSAPGDALVVPVTELAVGRAARVGHVTVQQLGFATWQLGLQVSQLGAESTLRSTSVAFGGDYARLRTDCRMVGRGATGELDAVYFGEATQTLDFRTFQTHVAPDCTSNLLFKGAGGGASRSVYTGLIRVGKDARGTNAFQTNRNIKLSEGAWAESVPNLVIENNDVHCSHASAVGPIDEEQRFYLESRGVPTEVAERLVVTGFFDEVLGRLPVPEIAPALREVVAAKFARRAEIEAAVGSVV